MRCPRWEAADVHLRVPARFLLLCSFKRVATGVVDDAHRVSLRQTAKRRRVFTRRRFDRIEREIRI